jgi:predicted Zn-dependent protease
MLEAALKVKSNYLAARSDYALVLIERQKYMRAREEINALLSLEPGNSYYLSLAAAACIGLGQHEAAIAVYRRLLEASPGDADLQVSLGHTLQTAGQQREAIVHTASSEQVRRPIFRDGLFQWRNYEPWLGPLTNSLGDALIRYLE